MSRELDLLVSRLHEQGIIDRMDLVILHRLPLRERIPYLYAREWAFRERLKRLDRLQRSVEGWT